MEIQAYYLALAFFSGLLLWPLSRLLIRKAIRSKRASVDDGSQIYGLDHGILNLKQPTTMWMNVGYWRDQIDHPNDFPRACKALLQVVLETAFKCQDDRKNGKGAMCLLDVGFGCGDQSLHFLRGGQESNSDIDGADGRNRLPSVKSYVGITNNTSQCSYARQRLGSVHSSMGTIKDDNQNRVNCEVFCEDAALPDKWSPKLKESLERMRAQSASREDLDMWLLALDTMYHFSPSRLALLRYARSELNASFMALDYMLADGDQAPTWTQRLLLRIICLLLSAPYGNFLTQDGYKQMLVGAGYRKEDIEIQDISEYVFGPLSKFMAKRDDQLRSIGLGIGAFHVARWVFSWWASSGIVRACIMVAKAENVKSRPD